MTGSASVFADSGSGFVWIADVASEYIADRFARFLTAQTGFPAVVRAVGVQTEEKTE